MLLKLFMFAGLVSFSTPSLAAYRCELFDRAENAPGGNVPVKVLLTDSDNFPVAKEACSTLVDRKNVVDYWLKWISPSALPKDWRLSNLLPQSSENDHTFVDSCAGKVRYLNLPNNRPGTDGGRLTVTGTTKKNGSTKELDSLSMNFLVPGFETAEGEYAHSVVFNANIAKVSKVTERNHIYHEILFDFAPSSMMSITSEGYTEEVNLIRTTISTEASNSFFITMTLQPVGGLVRTYSYVIDSPNGCSISSDK